jgi:hypothetical protein
MAKSIYTRLLSHASISQQPVHPLNLIIRPAGVAQSVERVALIPPSAIPTYGLLAFFCTISNCWKKHLGWWWREDFLFLVCEAWLGGQGRRWTWDLWNLRFPDSHL